MNKHQAGYSLIELLVVLALLGIIMIAMSNGIGFGARVWEKSQEIVGNGDRMRGTQTLLRNLLTHTYPRDASADGSNGDAAFSGTAQTLSFLTVAGEPIGQGIASRVKLLAEPGAQGLDLKLAWQDFTGKAHERVLVPAARAIAFSFAGLASDGTLNWADAWDGSSGVPTLVRIHIDRERGASSPWPDLIVHPLIDHDPACIFDAVSFTCRHG